MMAKPEFTIIVPVYNSVDTIEACVASIKAQTLCDWELILADNGSTDGTYAHIERLAATDRRIIALRVPQKGVANARNAGLEIARGEYICFVDSDDTIDRGYLEILRSHVQSDLVVCGYSVVNVGRDLMIIATDEHCPESLEWKLDETKIRLRNIFANGYMHFCWNKLFKSRIISDNNIRFSGIPVNEDYIFVMEYLRHVESISIINVPLYHWIRVDEKETGVNSIPDNLLEIYNKSHILTREFFKENCVADWIAYFSYELIIYKYYHAIRIGRLSKQEAFEKIKECIRNSLVKDAYKVYKPKTKGDALLHALMKARLYKLHYFITQKML